MPMWNKTYLQNSNSPLMEHLSFFHDHSMIMIMVITVMIMNLMKETMYYKNNNRYLLESHTTELFWTSLPAFMLIFIAVPSLKTLFMMEENMNPIITIKTMAYQWYWSYEYSNFMEKKFNSMNMYSNKMRLEMVSNNLIIPTMTPTQMLISSKDVIHSWTIPSLGVKTDATPGRMTQISFSIKRPSIMIGQCSEICGSGHSFMPITLEATHIKNFYNMT